MNLWNKYQTSILVPVCNLNQERNIVTFLQSLAKTHPERNQYEVIIVLGNDSSKEYCDRFSEYCGLGINIKEIDLHIWNVGYAQALNMATQMAQCSNGVLVCCNDDVVFENECISIMSDFLTNTSYSACGPLGCDEIYTHNGNIYTSPPYSIEEKYKDISILSGFMFGIKKKDYIDIGGIHPELVLSHEELEIALKFRRMNKKMALVGGMKYQHVFGISNRVNAKIQILTDEITTGWGPDGNNTHNQQIVKELMGEK